MSGSPKLGATGSVAVAAQAQGRVGVRRRKGLNGINNELVIL
jgi:hypothetical protein